MGRRVKEITITISDAEVLDEYLREHCGLDSLDIMELWGKLEEMKGVKIDWF